MQSILLILAALAAFVQAIQVTSPGKDDDWDLTKSNTITWTSVSSDPETVNIYVVDETVNPSVSKLVANNVKVSDGKYDLSGLDVPAGTGYQINLVSTTTSSILAQSGQFQFTGSASASTTASSSASSGTTTSASGSAAATSGSTTTTGTASSKTTLASSASSGTSGTKTSSGSVAATSTGAASSNNVGGSASLAAIVFGGALVALI
jgi:hypothetical protein